MKKKYLSLALSGIMLAGSLTACGSADSLSRSQNGEIVDILEYKNSFGIDMSKGDVSSIVEGTLKKLDKLGVTLQNEEGLDDFILGYPEDMLADMLEYMGTEDIEAMVLEYIACRNYNEELDTWDGGNDRLYAFDMERFWGDMYGDPLECLNTLFTGEFVISDVKEDFKNAEEAGIVAVDFKINGTEYHYDAKFDYDWFDTEIFRYIAELTESEDTGRHLYITAVGPQSVLLVYETEEWAAEFEKLFWRLE